ncbi:MAG TPA: hypothetical protein VIH86_02605 [Puia sp.]
MRKFSGKLIVCLNDDGVGADGEQKSNGIGLHNIAGRVDMQWNYGNNYCSRKGIFIKY